MTPLEFIQAYPLHVLLFVIIMAAVAVSLAQDYLNQHNRKAGE